MIAALCASVATVTGAQDAPPTPYFDARTHVPEYVGPGRELPPPENLAEIVIAFFGPADANDPEWGDAWRGATLAIEDANAQKGYRGLPFRLLSAWSENPWGSGVADLAKLVYGRGVWAIVGGVNGATTHLAEQIVVKAQLSLVNPGGTDPSVNFTNVPWMFTLPATDDRQAPLIAHALVDRRANEGWSVVTTTDRDAASAWRTIDAAPALHGLPAPLHQIVVAPVQADYRESLVDVARSGSQAVLVLAGARDAARIVRALRSQGYHGQIVGGATLGRRAFVAEAAADAEGVVFPLLFDPEQPEARTFVSRFRARWGTTPDYLAAHTYDAVQLIADAVRRAGPNRVLIRDALATSPASPGVSGPIAWDPTGRNRRPLTLGIWHDGRTGRPREGSK
jgi:branched-chain amino acid transport system substrate-binding protein